jgi:hypothetical protein
MMDVGWRGVCRTQKALAMPETRSEKPPARSTGHPVPDDHGAASVSIASLTTLAFRN